MRFKNISSSIANVTKRFSVQATKMSRSNDSRLHQRHLHLCYWPLSCGQLGTDLLFRDLTVTVEGIIGTDLPRSLEWMSQKQRGNMGRTKQLFQRLS